MQIVIGKKTGILIVILISASIVLLIGNEVFPLAFDMPALISVPYWLQKSANVISTVVGFAIWLTIVVIATGWAIEKSSSKSLLEGLQSVVLGTHFFNAHSDNPAFAPNLSDDERELAKAAILSLSEESEVGGVYFPVFDADEGVPNQITVCTKRETSNMRRTADKLFADGVFKITKREYPVLESMGSEIAFQLG